MPDGQPPALPHCPPVPGDPQPVETGILVGVGEGSPPRATLGVGVLNPPNLELQLALQITLKHNSSDPQPVVTPHAVVSTRFPVMVLYLHSLSPATAVGKAVGRRVGATVGTAVGFVTQSHVAKPGGALPT